MDTFVPSSLTMDRRPAEAAGPVPLVVHPDVDAELVGAPENSAFAMPAVSQEVAPELGSEGHFL
jgi:hypothetical protein